MTQMDVTQVTRICPRCQGCVMHDDLELAPYVCWNCGERYQASYVPLRRSPSELEMSSKARRSASHHEVRM